MNEYDEYADDWSGWMMSAERQYDRESRFYDRAAHDHPTQYQFAMAEAYVDYAQRVGAWG